MLPQHRALDVFLYMPFPEFGRDLGSLRVQRRLVRQITPTVWSEAIKAPEAEDRGCEQGL